MAISMFSNYGVKALQTTAPTGLKWQQVYILKDKENTKRVIRQVEELGFKALVLTIDSTILGYRRVVLKPGFFPGGLEVPIIRGDDTRL